MTKTEQREFSDMARLLQNMAAELRTIKANQEQERLILAEIAMDAELDRMVALEYT